MHNPMCHLQFKWTTLLSGQQCNFPTVVPSVKVQRQITMAWQKISNIRLWFFFSCWHDPFPNSFFDGHVKNTQKMCSTNGLSEQIISFHCSEALELCFPWIRTSKMTWKMQHWQRGFSSKAHPALVISPLPRSMTLWLFQFCLVNLWHDIKSLLFWCKYILLGNVSEPVQGNYCYLLQATLRSAEKGVKLFEINKIIG